MSGDCVGGKVATGKANEDDMKQWADDGALLTKGWQLL